METPGLPHVELVTTLHEKASLSVSSTKNEGSGNDEFISITDGLLTIDVMRDTSRPDNKLLNELHELMTMLQLTPFPFSLNFLSDLLYYFYLT